MEFEFTMQTMSRNIDSNAFFRHAKQNDQSVRLNAVNGKIKHFPAEQ